ncbi:MAG: hypothetical protein DHS20C19_08640 [Acidimicrobiales bacterium]|nr:MAG: hypothetical protein DHS20C19_08640 [Acidimicrobiales bacterium]
MTTNPRRTAAVTGAASGIGRALAAHLSEHDYDVTLADIDRDGVEAVADTIGGHRSVTLDVSDAGAMERFADDIGPVDLLCLNAGVLGASMGPPWEAAPAEWDRVLGVNLHGVVNGLRSFVPRLLQDQRSHGILITASLAGTLTWPGGGAYAASKHAVLAVAEQAAIHLADSPISVTVTCPTLVRTAMSDVGDDPADVAALALDAVASETFAVVSPGWSEALRARAEMLTTGCRPETPLPDAEAS